MSICVLNVLVVLLSMAEFLYFVLFFFNVDLRLE